MSGSRSDLASIARRALPLVDLTSLGDDDGPERIDALCRAASTPFGPTAAVCVWPRFVEHAVAYLAGSPVRVASVANFPEGDDDIERARTDARTIVDRGGDEIDVVFPWRAHAAGRREAGRALVAATREEIGDRTLKVILETGELVDPALIRTAADEALAAGADFLKTSTGKTARSATPEAARTLLHAIAAHDRPAGLKVSGGIRTTDQAATYLALADEIMGPDWVAPATFRFGASSLLDDLVAVLQAGQPSVDWSQLRAAAQRTAANARAPYSGLHVGAAGLTDSGRIVTGCNVESASYGLTLCAECGLVSALHAQQAGTLLAVSAVDGHGRLLTPCGRCRQLLFEMAGPELLVDHEPQPLTIAELLPEAFGPEHLPDT